MLALFAKYTKLQEEEVILTDTQDDAYTKTIIRVKAYTDSSSEIFK